MTKTEQLQLLADPPQITVHCFFGYCKHVVRATDPVKAHDAMERHYGDRHAREIEALVHTPVLTKDAYGIWRAR